MRLRYNNIEERIKDTLMTTLNMSFIETDDENSLEVIMPVNRFNVQTLGVLHGGATIALAESAAGVGSNNICGEDESCFGMQISVSHISSAKMNDTVRAIAKLLHKGKSTHIWDVDVRSETTGRLISSIRITNCVLKKR